MIDVVSWTTIVELLSIVDHSRRPDDHTSSALGNIHIILFGDFKQLPPATSQAPFIRLGMVHNHFDFRVLRQNRRVVKSDENSSTRKAEIENFHGVLMDISMGVPSERVKDFLVQSYVRGAMNCRTADKAELEGSTSVFTKRRQLGIIRECFKYVVAHEHQHPKPLLIILRIYRTCFQYAEVSEISGIDLSPRPLLSPYLFRASHLRAYTLCDVACFPAFCM